jgi:hypothetical protein
MPRVYILTLLIGVRVYIKASVAKLCSIPPICILDMAPHLNAITTSLRAVNDPIILPIQADIEICLEDVGAV